MALQIALVAREACFTFCAVSIFFLSGGCVTSADAMRAATRHARFTMESDLAPVEALSMDVTLVGFAVVWTTFANPSILEEAFERIAALHTCFGLPSFAIAAFWTSPFWAWLITEITPPTSVATIVAFATLFVATTTLAATRAFLFTFVPKEAVLAAAFAQAI